MKNTQMMIVAFMAPIIVSCSDGIPSDQFIEESVKNEVMRAIGDNVQADVFEVASIRKKDGRNIPEQNAYVADIVADLKLKTCGFFHKAETDWDLKEYLVFRELDECPAPPGGMVQAKASAAYSTAIRSIFGINSIVSVPGKAVFYHKEKGWGLEDVKLDPDRVAASAFTKNVYDEFKRKCDRLKETIQIGPLGDETGNLVYDDRPQWFKDLEDKGRLVFEDKNHDGRVQYYDDTNKELAGEADSFGWKGNELTTIDGNCFNIP